MSESEKKDSCVFKKMGRAVPSAIAILIMFAGIRMLTQAVTLAETQGSVTAMLSASAGFAVLIAGIFMLVKIFRARCKK